MQHHRHAKSSTAKFLLGGSIVVLLGVILNEFFPRSNHILLSSVGAALLISSSASIPVITQWILRRTFSGAEFLVLTSLGGILFLPVLLEGEYIALGTSPAWLPFANSGALLLLATTLLLLRKTSVSFSWKSCLSFRSHPELIGFIILQTVFILLIITAYRALPDLDPYKWLYKYSILFPESQFDSRERPLFGAFTFIGTKLLFVNIFTFYKYILPFFLILITFPAWLIANTFRDRNKRIAFLSILFLSPAALLYGTTAMPQQPIIILSYFFLLLLIYAALSKDQFFFILAGAIAFFGFFIHQAAALFIVAWVLGALLLCRRYILANKTISILVFLLILSNIDTFQPIPSFISNWLQIIYNNAITNGSVNFLYPAHYTNIDHNAMGWPGSLGVAKFYGFHMGPVTGMILITFVWLLFSKKFRAFVARSLRNSPEIITACAATLFFLIIAEVLPRFPNIALLPDRAWIFASIGMIVPAFLIVRYMEKVTRIHLFVIACCLILSVSGALYINTLKKYLITSAQWRSAQWITRNLPENRIFLASGYKNLIPIHADSRLFRISSDTYCGDINQYNDTVRRFRADNKQDILPPLQTTAYQILHSFENQYNQARTDSEKREILEILRSNMNDAILSADTELRTENKPSLLFPPKSFPHNAQEPFPVENVFRSSESAYFLRENDQPYIYYARSDPKNPYNQRGYTLSSWGFDGCPGNAPFVFDQYPDKFKRVYNDHEEVIIWKVL